MPRQRHGGSFAAAAGQDRWSGTSGWVTDSSEPETAGPDARPPSRRAVLRGAAGAGAASVAATALAGFAGPVLAAPRMPGRGADRPAGAPARADEAEQLILHVKDAKAGHIDIFRGTSLIKLRDPELAARLVKASRA